MTDAIVRELIAEIRKDRTERRQQFDRIELRLTTVERALVELANEIQEVRKGAGEEGQSIRKHLRAVSDFAGMTDPGDNSGGE